MQIIESAELFSKEKYVNTSRKDDVLYLDHLRGIVNRLKNIGISDQEVFAAAWLYNIIEKTNTTFDEIDKKFGSRVAVLVLALSKDKNMTKNQIEKQYTKQIKDASIEAKLIELCHISTNLKDLKNTQLSKTKRSKQVKKNLYYLSIIKPDLSKNKAQYPGIQNILNGINEIASSYGQKSIIL